MHWLSIQHVPFGNRRGATPNLAMSEVGSGNRSPGKHPPCAAKYCSNNVAEDRHNGEQQFSWQEPAMPLINAPCTFSSQGFTSYHSRMKGQHVSVSALPHQLVCLQKYMC